MDFNFRGLQMRLNLFDAGAEGQGSAAQGGDSAAASTQQQAGVTPDQQAATDAGSQTEDRQKAYRELIEGEYKDLYTQDVQRLVNRRFAETKGLQEQLEQYQPVMDMLMQRYNVSDVKKLGEAIESDNAYWEAAAERAGMDVEQYKRFSRLQTENAKLLREQRRTQTEQRAQRQLAKWNEEAAEVKKVYPSFDLERESANPQFLGLLRSNVNMRSAYEVIHMDEIKAAVSEMQARATEKKVVEGIRAKGMRPSEAGASSSSAFTSAKDVHKLTKKERADIAKRAARGEKITF